MKTQMYNSADRKKIHNAWTEFMETGKVRKGLIREEILQSWIVCRNLGLNPQTATFRCVSVTEKRKAIQENEFLINAARPFLKNLFNLVIKDMDMALFLTDRNGLVLEVLGEGPIWEQCKVTKAITGCIFDESSSGTIAPCISLRLDKPFQMVAEEHYLQAVHVASCAAAPIHDETGKVIGSLDITCTYETSLRHPHTLGMVVSAAQVIEDNLRISREMHKSFIANHYLSAAISGMSSGIIILDENDRINHCNPAAGKIIGFPIDAVLGMKIDSIINNERIIKSLETKNGLHDYEILLDTQKKKNRCLVSLEPIVDAEAKKIGSFLTFKELKEIQTLVKKVVGFHARYNFSNIWGNSSSFLKTINTAKRMANTSSNIVIIGESGTGKEMLSQSMHNMGKNSREPFLAINCSAIPNDLIESELFGYEAGTFTGALKSGKPGLFELAGKGTLFLDEVNAMSLDMQTKLLRVLEEKRFHRIGGTHDIVLEARIIAASNKNLSTEVERGYFRNDLYYRLCVVEIHIPPLRERKEDIPMLVEKFMQEINSRLEKDVENITPEAMRYLEKNNWPGNIRQLKNWLERAISLTDNTTLTINDFPQDESINKIKSQQSEKIKENRKDSMSLSDMEKEMILSVLKEYEGNIALTAKKLKIGRSTLYRKMEKYGITLMKTITD